MDPVSSVLGVAGFALTAIMTLHRNIRSLQSQNRDARALKDELSDLTGVLSSLLETIASNPTLDFEALRGPLQRCGNACEEYGKIIARCTKNSSDISRPSVLDWIKQKYLQGDINDFRAMLAAHKTTINIALVNANLRTATVSPEALEAYKDMICDTTIDLNAHIKDLQEKIDRIWAGDATAVDDVAIEWQAMMDEKESTQRGLNICVQLSAQIAKFETVCVEHLQFSERLSAHKYDKSSLGEARSTVKSLVARLQTYEALISRQLDAIRLNDAFSEPVAEQLASLQQTRECISQCIQIVSEAGESANESANTEFSD
ncbi:hypothetical protein EDB81DRAFT_633294, partial [Dactylonectria macrodidyma]